MGHRRNMVDLWCLFLFGMRLVGSLEFCMIMKDEKGQV